MNIARPCSLCSACRSRTFAPHRPQLSPHISCAIRNLHRPAAAASTHDEISKPNEAAYDRTSSGGESVHSDRRLSVAAVGAADATVGASRTRETSTCSVNAAGRRTLGTGPRGDAVTGQVALHEGRSARGSTGRVVDDCRRAAVHSHRRVVRSARRRRPTPTPATYRTRVQVKAGEKCVKGAIWEEDGIKDNLQ